MIKVIDPRRDTEAWGEVVLNFFLRFINTFFTYLCSQPFYILIAYLCFYTLFSLYTVGFCKAMEYVDNIKPSSHHNKQTQKIRQRYQKGRWKHTIQGQIRARKVSGWSRIRNKAREDNVWKKYLQPKQLPQLARWRI